MTKRKATNDFTELHDSLKYRVESLLKIAIGEAQLSEIIKLKQEIIAIASADEKDYIDLHDKLIKLEVKEVLPNNLKYSYSLCLDEMVKNYDVIKLYKETDKNQEQLDEETGTVRYSHLIPTLSDFIDKLKKIIVLQKK